MTGAAVESSSSLVSAEVGVHRVPVPAEAIVVAVRWYLRYNLSYRDVEELLAERPSIAMIVKDGCRLPREEARLQDRTLPRHWAGE